MFVSFGSVQISLCNRYLSVVCLALLIADVMTELRFDLTTQPGWFNFDFIFQHNIQYRILGVVPAPYFFRINPRTGSVTVRNPLASGSDTTYTVSICLKNIQVLHL